MMCACLHLQEDLLIPKTDEFYIIAMTIKMYCTLSMFFPSVSRTYNEYLLTQFVCSEKLLCSVLLTDT